MVIQWGNKNPNKRVYILQKNKFTIFLEDLKNHGGLLQL